MEASCRNMTTLDLELHTLELTYDLQTNILTSPQYALKDVDVTLGAKGRS